MGDTRITVKLTVKVDYMRPPEDMHEKILREEHQRQLELYLRPFQKTITANLEMLLTESN
jgi:hypothetical protein